MQSEIEIKKNYLLLLAEGWSRDLAARKVGLTPKNLELIRWNDKEFDTKCREIISLTSKKSYTTLINNPIDFELKISYREDLSKAKQKLVENRTSRWKGKK